MRIEDIGNYDEVERKVVALREKQNLSYQKIADKLSLPRYNVMRIYQDAKQRQRDAVQRKRTIAKWSRKAPRKLTYGDLRIIRDALNVYLRGQRQRAACSYYDQGLILTNEDICEWAHKLFFQVNHMMTEMDRSDQ